MKDVPFQLIHSILCEDARREAGTGKGFYIGVFTDSIIGAASPVLIERLTAVFCVKETGKEKIRTFKVAFDGPSDAQLPSLEDSDYSSPALGAHILVVQVLGVALTSGEYRATLTLNGHAQFHLPFRVEINPARFAQIQSS